MTPSQQAANAIQWFNALLSGEIRGRKIHQGKGKLGDFEEGFCCLGAGCVVLEISYERAFGYNEDFTDSVGLRHNYGCLDGMTFYHKGSLISINDKTRAGFKRIAKFMIKHPEAAFIPEVAKLIRRHYE